MYLRRPADWSDGGEHRVGRVRTQHRPHDGRRLAGAGSPDGWVAPRTDLWISPREPSTLSSTPVHRRRAAGGAAGRAPAEWPCRPVRDHRCRRAYQHESANRVHSGRGRVEHQASGNVPYFWEVNEDRLGSLTLVTHVLKDGQYVEDLTARPGTTVTINAAPVPVAFDPAILHP